MDGKGRLVSVTPTVGLVAYSAGDLVGGVTTLTDALDSSSDTGAVLSIQIIDKAKQNADLNLLFFNASPELISADNAALDISDSEMADKFVGRVSITSSDYSSLANCSEATKLGVGLYVQGNLSKHLYLVIQAQSAPTYVSSSDLKIKVGMVQD